MRHEKRQLRRWQLIYYLRVFDEPSGELLGHVVDITTEGLMLISAAPIAIGKIFELRMEYPSPEGIGRRREIRLEAESLWSNQDVNVDFHDTGFRLLDPSEDAILELQALIEELHFDGPPALEAENIYVQSSVQR